MLPRTLLIATFGLTLGCTSKSPDTATPTSPRDTAVEQVPGAEGVHSTDGNFDPDHVVQIEFNMSEEDWDALRLEKETFVTALSGDCMSEPIGGDYTDFSASISMDGETLDNIGIRKKGLIGSQSTTKPSLSINLDEYVDGAELFDVDNLTLNNGVQDPALMRQCLVYDLFDKAGLPSPRCNFARVSMNGEDLGIYIHVEPVKPSMLRDHFESDEGDLYEGALSDFHADWYKTFDPDTRETDTEMTGIQALAAALQEEDAILDVLAEHVDVDRFFTFWAMETIVGHWDSYTGNRNNFFVYDDPATDTFVFIPWGADGVMNINNGTGQIFSASILPNLLLKDTEANALFESRLLELLDTVWDEDEINSEIDRMEALLETELGNDDLSQAIDDLRIFVYLQRDALEDSLPAKADDLGSPGCLKERGAIAATFQTEWGSNESDDGWNSQGELDLSISWYGEALELFSGGVIAGVGDDGDGDMLAFLSSLDPMGSAYFLSYFVFEAATLTEGASYAFDDALTGYLLYTEPAYGGAWGIAAYLGDGTVQFDSLSTEPGGTISGTLTTSIYVWELAE